MQFTWLVAVFLALLAVVSGLQCPTKFSQSSDNLCVAERPVHGSCPEHSEFDANKNKCVYGKKL